MPITSDLFVIRTRCNGHESLHGDLSSVVEMPVGTSVRFTMTGVGYAEYYNDGIEWRRTRFSCPAAMLRTLGNGDTFTLAIV